MDFDVHIVQNHPAIRCRTHVLADIMFQVQLLCKCHLQADSCKDLVRKHTSWQGRISRSKISAWSSALGKPSTRNRLLLLLIMAFFSSAIVTCGVHMIKILDTETHSISTRL